MLCSFLEPPPLWNVMDNSLKCHPPRSIRSGCSCHLFPGLHRYSQVQFKDALNLFSRNERGNFSKDLKHSFLRGNGDVNGAFQGGLVSLGDVLAKQAGLKWQPFLFHLYQHLSMLLPKATEASRNTHLPQPALDWMGLLPG